MLGMTGSNLVSVSDPRIKDRSRCKPAHSDLQAKIIDPTTPAIPNRLLIFPST